MATRIDSSVRVINGIHGELWFDGIKWAEVDSFKIVIRKNKATVLFCGNPVEGTKMTSVRNSGNIGGYHVDSANAAEIRATQEGRDVRHTLRGKLADPDSWGFETVNAYDVSFDELTPMDFQAGSVSKFNTPFTCGVVELDDQITPR